MLLFPFHLFWVFGSFGSMLLSKILTSTTTRASRSSFGIRRLPPPCRSHSGASFGNAQPPPSCYGHFHFNNPKDNHNPRLPSFELNYELSVFKLRSLAGVHPWRLLHVGRLCWSRSHSHCHNPQTFNMRPTYWYFDLCTNLRSSFVIQLKS